MVYFYGRETPSLGELVVCQITKIIQDAGYMVSLIEYDNRQGFVGLKQITQAKWFRNIRSLAEEGDIEVMEVISVSEDGDIDLTRRYISDDKKQETFTRYRKWKRVYDYLANMAAEERRQQMMKHVIHPYIMEDEIVSTTKDSEDIEDEEDEGEEDGKNEETLCISVWISTKTFNEEDQFDETFRKLLTNVVGLLEHKEEEKIHSVEMEIPELKGLRIAPLNAVLEKLDNLADLDIRTSNTKTATYMITSREKMLKKRFDGNISNLKSIIRPTIQSLTVNGEPEKEQLSLENIELNEDENLQPICSIGCSGHVAHGKTTLIEAITGVDTRKYKKEIASNRTLNIGYTNAKIVKCICSDTTRYLAEKDAGIDCACSRVHISIVDCPGHNVLLSTMITGAQIMDTCMLVVSAHEPCPQPQTEEHLSVLQIIGRNKEKFKDGLVLQNKVDLVDVERTAESKKEIDKFLSDSVLENTSVVPISAQMRINVSYVLQYIYEYASAQQIKRREESSDPNVKSTGIIVRTFDINKPGAKIVVGAVIGGSIVKGTFRVGDEICLVPYGIAAKIISMKTKKTNITKAEKGGLIAIQTDINPSYCPALVGCSFIKKKDFLPENILTAGTDVKVKYYLLKSSSIDKISENEKIVINHNGHNSEAMVIKSSKKHSRMSIKLSQPLYMHPNEELSFTIIYGHRLVGYGKTVQEEKERHEDVKEPCSQIVEFSIPEYNILYEEFAEKLQKWKESSIKQMRLPIPKTKYLNTFTTVSNFEDICTVLGTAPEKLGAFIQAELGLKSWSVTGTKQLVLKGRTDEKRVMTVLHNYVVDSRCKLCKQNTIYVVRNMGVKQKLCSNCPWKG